MTSEPPARDAAAASVMEAVRAFRRAAHALADPLPRGLFSELERAGDLDLLAAGPPMVDFSPFARIFVPSDEQSPAPLAEDAPRQRSGGEPEVTGRQTRSGATPGPISGISLLPPGQPEKGAVERARHHASAQSRAGYEEASEPGRAALEPASTAELLGETPQGPPVFSLRRPSRSGGGTRFGASERPTEAQSVRAAPDRPSAAQAVGWARFTAPESALEQSSEAQPDRSTRLGAPESPPDRSTQAQSAGGARSSARELPLSQPQGDASGLSLLAILADEALRVPQGRSGNVIPAAPAGEPGTLGRHPMLPGHVPAARAAIGQGAYRMPATQEMPGPSELSQWTEDEPSPSLLGSAPGAGASRAASPPAASDAGQDLLDFDADRAGAMPSRPLDAQALAALVNDALIEQARRHGLDLS
jgi:hypothetical protein